MSAAVRFFAWLWQRILKYPVRFKEMISQILNVLVILNISDMSADALGALNVMVAFVVAFFTEGMSVSTAHMDAKVEALSEVKGEIKAQERMKILTDPGNNMQQVKM